MKIAVVGAGISGLTAAYVLQREHQVSVFERADHIGGHALTVDVKQHGKRHRAHLQVATAKRVFWNGRSGQVLLARPRTPVSGFAPQI